ncbi:MAG: DegV family protein [Anaerolineae bacterium]
MNSVAILTDSGCDIPPDLVEKHQIVVVPLYVIWGDEDLRDGQDIDNPTFYDRLTRDPIHPQTSQPAPSDFARALAQSRADQALIITLTGALSGTYDAALQAANMVDMPVHVVDSRSLSMGLGAQVLAAAREREAGGSLQTMIAAAEKVRDSLSLVLTLETLEYLHRGGRIGTAAKVLASAVRLKPLLEVDHSTGLLEVVGRIRTRRKALARIVDELFTRVDETKPLRAAVLHAAAAEEALALAKEIRRRAQPLELIVAQITPALGVHGGPGAVGACAYNV